MLARANSPDLIRPWAIIIVNAPSHPHFDIDEIPAITMAMWLIDEWAIIDFISVWRTHKIVVKTAPHIEIGRMAGAIVVMHEG